MNLNTGNLTNRELKQAFKDRQRINPAPIIYILTMQSDKRQSSWVE